jgi:long-subunit acyl-CoA synthetase (AMP-forming)
MSPANLEQKLRSASPLITQAVCIGDRRPYNVALIALDVEATTRWATHRGLGDARLDLLAVHEELHAEIRTAVEAANGALSRVEQVKRFAVLASEWLPGGDELTPTMKLKRKPIHEKYSAAIERLYRE